jgi:hypothetical protein
VVAALALEAVTAETATATAAAAPRVISLRYICPPGVFGRPTHQRRVVSSGGESVGPRTFLRREAGLGHPEHSLLDAISCVLFRLRSLKTDLRRQFLGRASDAPPIASDVGTCISVVA